MHVSDVEWTRSVSRSNTFRLSFERVRLLVRITRFERIQVVDRTRLDKKALYLVSDGNFANPIFNSFVKDSWCFQLVLYTRQCFVMLTSREHAVCLLSGIRKRPLVGGCLTTSSIVNSIGALASVRYKEIVRYGRFHCIYIYVYIYMYI